MIILDVILWLFLEIWSLVVGFWIGEGFDDGVSLCFVRGGVWEGGCSGGVGFVGDFGEGMVRLMLFWGVMWGGWLGLRLIVKKDEGWGEDGVGVGLN